MKRKLTFLLFGLLLAVGWTNVAFAQSYILKAADMQTNGEYWTYEWEDASGVTQTSPYINPVTQVADSVTNPYQIYGLLRAVYMDKRLPGPYYSAYMKDGITREDPVFYGGMAGGWDIPYTEGGITYNDIVINASMTSSRDDISHCRFVSIQIVSGNTTITTLTANDIASLPDGWSKSGTWNSASGYFNTTSTSNSLTFDGDKLQGYSNVQVVIRAYHNNYYQDYGYARVYVNNNYNQLSGSEANYTWNIASNNSGTVNESLYKPENEGYTALVVALYNDTTKIYPEPSAYWGSFEFTTKARLIQYITENISHVKLLTDGVRIGDGYDQGTVFNASGTYNRFFFLGKGQARKKAESVKTRINSGTWPSYCGEEGPFKFMYEEFSPTSGAQYSDITDFYMEMMDGQVYNVVHDCASVIQNKHQFSMSGKKGVEYKALSGLNFFVPDYRLLWWDGTGDDLDYPNVAIDGRDMDPYQRVNNDGTHGSAYRNVTNSDYYYFSAYYAQYNQQHAPKVGIYMLSLEADAKPTSTEHVYKVNIDWTSSLNEMSGGIVDQNYILYIVKTDSLGNEKLDTLVVTGQTHYDYLVPQNEHSYTITYIVQGSPSDTEHPEFIAWSNQDAVVIPGWNDFLSLELEHYESDFDVQKERNWYRNFLVVDNEDEVNALTTTRIAGGENLYTLYRYDFNKPEPKIPVARLNLAVNNDGKTVDYTVVYKNQDVEPEENDKYELSNMGFNMVNDSTTRGTLTVKGNGDIIIHPSDYDVNFYSIDVRNAAGTSSITSWTASQTLQSRGWEVSNGSQFIKDQGTNYYYMEGSGYIRVPASKLNGNTTVRVVINAARDGNKAGSITVNDSEQKVTGATATNYTWNNINTTSTAKLRGNRAGGDAITEWVYSTSTNLPLTTGWVLTPGNTDGDSGLGNGYNSDHSIWINSPGYITIPASMLEGYKNISVVVDYGVDGSYSGTNSLYVTVNNVQSPATTNTTGYDTYTWNDVDASNGITITPRNGWVSFYSIRVYGEEDVTPPTPVVEGIVRLGNLPIVDQFYADIPATNDHPNRYAYVLRYVGTDTVINSSVAEVPVQHTGAKMKGYYTHAEMKGDTVPANFLTENVISAEVDMNLSPTSAPYFYTINSKKNGKPAYAWSNYVSVLQRRSSGDYQEMQGNSPYKNDLYEAGPHDFFDFRKVVAESVEDSLSYVPIVWTDGIARRYYAQDTLHNSYGAPVWEVRRGDVNVYQDGTVCQRQARKDASGNWVWNSTVNYTVDDVDYSLYLVSVNAKGILPNSNIEYEPYMFRLWLYDENASLRNYTWMENGNWTKIEDAGAYTENGGMWKLLDTKMCENWSGGEYDPDLDYVVSINEGTSANPDSWKNNIGFVAPISGFTPKLYVRFYYKIKGATEPVISGLRGQGDEDNVGHVVVRGHNPDPGTAVREIIANGEVVSQTFYNVQGLESDKPFEGINIVVTRYSNGATTTTKVRY